MPSFSPWYYDTGAENSVSVFVASGGAGTLYFKNSSSSTTFAVDYSYAAFGPGGEDIGSTISSTGMWSTGTGVVNIYGDFEPGDFPRSGWLLTVGANTPGFGGMSGSIFIFSNSWGLPQSFVTTVGEVGSVLPGVGAAIGHVGFAMARLNEAPPPSTSQPFTPWDTTPQISA